jgi:hypothetical protein
VTSLSSTHDDYERDSFRFARDAHVTRVRSSSRLRTARIVGESSSKVALYVVGVNVVNDVAQPWRTRR